MRKKTPISEEQLPVVYEYLVNNYVGDSTSMLDLLNENLDNPNEFNSILDSELTAQERKKVRMMLYSRLKQQTSEDHPVRVKQNTLERLVNFQKRNGLEKESYSGVIDVLLDNEERRTKD